jgi:hypothetical protein
MAVASDESSIEKAGFSPAAFASVRSIFTPSA